MATKLNPYINFDGNTKPAMEFYRSVFGGELTMQTYEQFHASDDPSENDKIMHAQLESEGVTLMGADVPNRMEFKPGSNFSLSLSGEDEASLRAYFEKLADGGQITMPLEKAQWGDTFGMCVDKFGINWMVNINAQPN